MFNFKLDGSLGQWCPLRRRAKQPGYASTSMALSFSSGINNTMLPFTILRRASPPPRLCATTRHLPLLYYLSHQPSPHTGSLTLLSQWIPILTATFSATQARRLFCRYPLSLSGVAAVGRQRGRMKRQESGFGYTLMALGIIRWPAPQRFFALRMEPRSR